MNRMFKFLTCKYYIFTSHRSKNTTLLHLLINNINQWMQLHEVVLLGISLNTFLKKADGSCNIKGEKSIF